jgi:hypothetical protein
VPANVDSVWVIISETIEMEALKSYIKKKKLKEKFKLSTVQWLLTQEPFI